MGIPVHGRSLALQCDDLILGTPQHRVMLHPRPSAHEYSASEPPADGFCAFAPANGAFGQPDSTLVGKSRHRGLTATMLQAGPELHGTPARHGQEPDINL